MKRWKIETETDVYEVCAEDIAVIDGNLALYVDDDIVFFANALFWETMEPVCCTDEEDCCLDDSCCDTIGEDGCC